MGPILGNEKLLDALFSSIRQNRLAGCYILEGAKGTGKRSIARFVAASLLCPNRNAKGEACLQCPSCRRVLAGNHIDVFELTPEEKGKRIPVSAVREMLRNSYVLLARVIGGYLFFATAKP